MRGTLEEYGYLMIAVLFAAALTVSIIPMFLDGGIIKDAIVNYISNLC